MVKVICKHSKNYCMINLIKHNGIYYYQGDKKNDGTYYEDELGNLVHREYVQPTAFQKLKHQLKYSYPMNTETVFTDYFYFDKNEPGKVISSSMNCDVISFIRKHRNYISYLEPIEFEFVDGYILLNKDRYFTKLLIKDEGNTMLVSTYSKYTNQRFKPEFYRYLDWNS